MKNTRRTKHNLSSLTPGRHGGKLIIAPAIPVSPAVQEFIDLARGENNVTHIVNDPQKVGVLLAEYPKVFGIALISAKRGWRMTEPEFYQFKPINLTITEDLLGNSLIATAIDQHYPEAFQRGFCNTLDHNFRAVSAYLNCSPAMAHIVADDPASLAYAFEHAAGHPSYNNIFETILNNDEFFSAIYKAKPDCFSKALVTASDNAQITSLLLNNKKAMAAIREHSPRSLNIAFDKAKQNAELAKVYKAAFREWSREEATQFLTYWHMEDLIADKTPGHVARLSEPKKESTLTIFPR